MLKSETIQYDTLYDKVADQILMPEDFYLNVVKNIGRLSGSDKLLDIGCGNGYLLEKIAKFNPNAELFGIDFSKKLLGNARKRLGKKVQLIKGNALALPFTANEFDLVIMTEVIEHLEDPVKGLYEAKRVLKKRGAIILTFPNASSYKPFYPWIKSLPNGKVRSIFIPAEDPEKTGQPIDKVYFFNEIMSLLKKTNFKVKKVLGTIFFPYFVEIPILSSIAIFLWRKTAFDRTLEKVIGPKWAYRVLVKAMPVR